MVWSASIYKLNVKINYTKTLENSRFLPYFQCFSDVLPSEVSDSPTLLSPFSTQGGFGGEAGRVV